MKVQHLMKVGMGREVEKIRYADRSKIERCSFIMCGVGEELQWIIDAGKLGDDKMHQSEHVCRYSKGNK